MDVLVANTDAPVGPLSTTRGAGMSSNNVVSVGRQQGDGFSRNPRMRLVVDGVEIADSEVVEMVATSTGAAPEGLAPGTAGDPDSGVGQYVAGQYDQYQCDQYHYDDPRYGEAHPEQYDSPRDSEASRYDGPGDARLGQGSDDDEAASATPPVSMEGDNDAPPAERFAGVSSGAERASAGSDAGQGSPSRKGGGLKQLPRPGERPPRGRSGGRSLALARPRGVSDPQTRRPALDGGFERGADLSRGAAPPPRDVDDGPRGIRQTAASIAFCAGGQSGPWRLAERTLARGPKIGTVVGWVSLPKISLTSTSPRFTLKLGKADKRYKRGASATFEGRQTAEERRCRR